MDGSNDSSTQKPTKPLPPATTASSAPLSKKRLKRSIKWWIIGGICGLVVLTGGAILMVTFSGGSSREDYARAAEYMRSHNGLSLAELVNTSTKEESKQRTAKHVGHTEEYFDKLGAERAMRDSDVKQTYDAYRAEWQKVRAFVESFPDKFYEPAQQAVRLGSEGVCRANDQDIIIGDNPPEGVARPEWRAMKSSARYVKKTETCPQEVAALKKFNIKELTSYADAVVAYRETELARYRELEGGPKSFGEDDGLNLFPSLSKVFNDMLKDFYLTELERDLYALLEAKRDK